MNLIHVFGENSDFTVQERIILHLGKYNGFRDHYLNPESVTQEGIAGAVGIARNHVPRAMHGLKEVDLVDELKGRVKGSDRRKKVYFLSEKGITRVNDLREKMRESESVLTDIPGAPGFVGREKELREIKKGFGTGKAVLVTGADGIGKTYLASRAVMETAGKMPVLWYSVPENGTLHGFLREMAGFLNRNGNGLLGYRLGAASALKDEDIIDLLASSVKNCAAFLDDFNNADDDLKRFMLKIVEALGRFKGLRLMLISDSELPASRKLVTVKLAGLDTDSVRRILETRNIDNLDGACDIAAANPLFLKILTAGSGPCGSLDEFLDAVHGSLSDEERRAMSAISIHQGPVASELLFSSGSFDYQVLVNLAAKGLLRELDDRTFDTHRLLREFFTSKARPELLARMHMGAAAVLARGDSYSWLEAQKHLLMAGAHEQCARSVVLSGVKVVNRGLRREVEEILGALNLGGLDGATRADILLLRGYLAKLRGEWARALEDYAEALDMFGAMGLEDKKADALAKMGRVHLEKGEYDMAVELFDRGLGCLEKGPNIIRARIMDELATIHLRKREIDEARAKLELGMEQAKQIGDSEMEARIHNTVGNLHMIIGSLSEAKEHYRLSLDGLKDVDDQMEIILCNNLAIIEFRSGRVEEAIELWEQAAGKAEAMKNLNVMLTLSNLGSIHYSIGNWNRAAECCAKALEISEMVGKGNITAASRSTLGHMALHRSEGDWIGHYGKALELRTGLGDRSGMASSHNDMADGFIAGKKWDEAEIHAQTALALAKEKGDPEQTARSWLALADIHAGKQEYSKSKEYLKMALLKSREIKNGELIGRTYRSIGLVSAQEGEEFVAERYLRESVGTLENERRPLLLAQSLRDYANVLEKSGLGEPADYHKRSKEIFETLGIKERDLASG